MTTMSKSARTAYGETHTIDMGLFKAMCNLIDPDMLVEIKDDEDVLLINNK